MLSYGKLFRKPRLFKSFTGLSVKQFNDIYKEIESKYEKYEIKRLSSNRKYRIRERKRDIGGGRKTFQVSSEGQDYHGFGLLPSVHHLYLDGIPIWLGSE